MHASLCFTGISVLDGWELIRIPTYLYIFLFFVVSILLDSHKQFNTCSYQMFILLVRPILPYLYKVEFISFLYFIVNRNEVETIPLTSIFSCKGRMRISYWMVWSITGKPLRFPFTVYQLIYFHLEAT